MTLKKKRKKKKGEKWNPIISVIIIIIIRRFNFPTFPSFPPAVYVQKLSVNRVVNRSIKIGLAGRQWSVVVVDVESSLARISAIIFQFVLAPISRPFQTTLRLYSCSVEERKKRKNPRLSLLRYIRIEESLRIERPPFPRATRTPLTLTARALARACVIRRIDDVQ